MKDRTVNIPIFEADVLKTIESLPRTPSQAGIIPVNLKRRLMYKQTHKTQYVSVPKVLKALETLKKLGNKYYQFVPDFDDFKKKCKDTDTEGFSLLFQDEKENEELEGVYNDNTLLDNNQDISEVQEIVKISSEIESCQTQDSDQSDKEEEEYRRKDFVKKWQFEYNRSTCFSNNYPEINYKEDTSAQLSVAPGEGKLPTNILEEVDWDLKSFPCLHPDGENSLQSQRQIPLGDQDYFNQRLLNKDSKFAENAAYVFAAVAYIEKKQIERNKGISYIRGKSETDKDGIKTYSLDDPYSVLDNIKNTPRYWQ